jgi:spermidine synthase
MEVRSSTSAAGTKWKDDFSMQPWVHLDTADVPGGAVPLKLMQRGAEYSIMVGGNELMNSRLSGSEEALAELAAERLAGVRAPRVLIGGLGMGFTLRAALERFGADAEIVVAELVPAVVGWARGPLAPVFAGCLDDPRVSIVVADVAKAIGDRAQNYDAILLDVDNGPDGVSRDANGGLYGATGLRAAHAALKPGGLLAVWSAGPSAEFTKRLGRSGFDVEEVMVRARKGGRGARHVVWLGRRR